MKLPIHIEYANGESAIYIAQVPEWSKWEQKTGNTITQAPDKVGLNDLPVTDKLLVGVGE